MSEGEIEANQVGVSAGQIAMGEFILLKYKGQMSTKLEGFIQKVITAEYEKISLIVEKPAEDIALMVGKLFPK